MTRAADRLKNMVRPANGSPRTLDNAIVRLLVFEPVRRHAGSTGLRGTTSRPGEAPALYSGQPSMTHAKKRGNA